MSPETKAAILGAVVGAAIALVSQATFAIVAMFRGRRVAASMIYAELITNYANASAALNGLGWPAIESSASRAAWDAYGGRLLLPWNRAHDVGAVAMAYNRIDDIAWYDSKHGIERDSEDQADFSKYELDIQEALYVTGRAAGYSDRDLANRGIPIAEVRARQRERGR